MIGYTGTLRLGLYEFTLDTRLSRGLALARLTAEFKGRYVKLKESWKAQWPRWTYAKDAGYWDAANELIDQKAAAAQADLQKITDQDVLDAMAANFGFEGGRTHDELATAILNLQYDKEDYIGGIVEDGEGRRWTITGIEDTTVTVEEVP